MNWEVLIAAGALVGTAIGGSWYIGQELGRVSASISNQEFQVTELNQQVDELNVRIGRMEDTAGKLSVNVNEAKLVSAIASKKFDIFDSEIAEFSERITAIAFRTPSSDSGQIEATKGVDDLKNRVAGLEADLEDFRKDLIVAALELKQAADEFENVQTTVSQISRDAITKSSKIRLMFEYRGKKFYLDPGEKVQTSGPGEWLHMYANTEQKQILDIEVVQ